MHCPKCGEIIEKEQRFCEFCGYDLINIEIQEKVDSIEEKIEQNHNNKPYFLPYNNPGGLFDINRNFYLFKEKYWDWGSGDILDEHGNIIGKMKRKIFSIRRKIELREIDGTVAATIHTKLASLRGAQDLKDPEGNLIARIKKKFFSLFRPKFYLEDAAGRRWFEAQGKFLGFSFKIYDLSSRKVVAEVEKLDKWRDIFFGGLFDYKDMYALRILDNTIDRRILTGFVLSIDNVLHDV